jgi:hypothetical protein
MFEIAGEAPSPRLILSSSPGGGWVPPSMADVDGSEKPELIGKEWIGRATGVPWDAIEQLEIPNHDCDC